MRKHKYLCVKPWNLKKKNDDNNVVETDVRRRQIGQGKKKNFSLAYKRDSSVLVVLVRGYHFLLE